ncbi:MAG TPA: two-component regulator propeller domain-containing protein, partial [Bacteroidales bacterium]
MKKFLFISGGIIFLSLFSFHLQVKAQLYKFQKFGSEKGICHPFIYSINQDKNGFIWALTGTGLCRFDGFTFSKNGNSKDSLSESSAEVSFKDKDNNLWFGYSDGSIAFYDGKKFRFLKSNDNQSGKITGIVQDKDGNILASNQNTGLYIIDKSFRKTVVGEPFSGKLIFSFNITSGNELLIGTDDGVIIYDYNSNSKKIKEVSKIEGLPSSKITKIARRNIKDNFWIATEDAGLYAISLLDKNKFLVDNLGARINLGNDNIQSVFEDPLSNIWISTFGKGLFKVTLAGDAVKEIINYNSSNGLGRDDVKDVFEDREGNIWVATFGGGLAYLLNASFISYNFSKQLKDNNIHAVCFDKDGYWIGGDRGLIKIYRSTTKPLDIYTPTKGLPSDIVTALFVDKTGTLWIGTDKNGIFQILSGKNRITPFFKGENSLANSINSINGLDDYIYVGTKNGAYQFNINTKKQQHYSTLQGLPHNDIHEVYVDSKGIAWVATHSNMIFALNNDTKHLLKGAGEIEFTAIAKDTSGNMWAGTNGNGVFKFITNQKKDTFNYFSMRDGLKSDFCYALLSDKYGNIWVGHRLGISRINSITNKIRTYGSEYFSGDINLNAITQNSTGDIIFGTTDGLVIYESSKDKMASTPPIVNISSVTINDSVYDISKKITLPYSNYRVKIQFIGLNYSNPEQVTYQYKLEGFESKWSEPSTNHEAIFSLSQDNDYTFMVKACNSDGTCSEIPVSFHLKIRKPFWKTWWFIGSAIIILIFSVYLIIKIRERKQKEFQAYLEKLLDERTREVREQKEEIELKNRDITDSINYAQRIQASILPSLRKLQNIFSGSFVYYLPRNIVSGDFYWFEVIPNTNKFLIVCADSTGHGVPGAFMSIIGTTLLKDIFSRPQVQKPSDILEHLDNELKLTLNQNMDGERPNDGMDIIVCEIDIKTYYARFSSAMRPFIVYQNGEQLYFKGSRSSIGGQMKEEKIFEDVELQLTKGDLIYMFSDGYPDQF